MHFEYLKFRSSPDELNENIDKFFGFIDEHLSNNIFPDRIDKIKGLYESDIYSERLISAPASSKANYHNCFPGGYIDHVNRVISFALIEYMMWNKMGLDVSTFSKEELVFSAINHDLGKLGLPYDGHEVYLPNDSEWHVRERGEFYKANLNTNFSTVPDASLNILQLHGIQCTSEEYYAIKLHDGLYDESNKPYFMGYSGARYQSNLPLVLHIADNKAARFEYQRWKNCKD